MVDESAWNGTPYPLRCQGRAAFPTRIIKYQEDLAALRWAGYNLVSSHMGFVMPTHIHA